MKTRLGKFTVQMKRVEVSYPPSYMTENLRILFLFQIGNSNFKGTPHRTSSNQREAKILGTMALLPYIREFNLTFTLKVVEGRTPFTHLVSEGLQLPQVARVREG
jgi:hypothetical protein